MASRTKNTTKNIVWGFGSNILSMIVHAISRTIFVYTIGVEYLGINGLFTSILGMLSLTELGIGTAINFSLYKPVADGDVAKITSLMRIYKRAYKIIALIITIMGLSILPFLRFLITDISNVDNAYIYYVIFLFNTVTSYFVSYKYGLVYAEQKGYIINNFNSVATIIITASQAVALALFRNYLVYLIVQSALQLGQKIFIGVYLNKRYPYLNDKNVNPLPKEETEKIKKNVFALIIHKIGEVSIYQTDNIIISAFISTVLVGKISNYNLVITSVTTFINIIFNSVTASIGNLIATESKKRQREIFDIYNFLGFWLYGFASICYWVLFTPFISLWIGSANLIDTTSLLLIVLSQYFTGQRLTVNNMKTAGGIFKQDRFVSLWQGGINLVVSLALASLLGLPGVYIGTVVSGLYANIARPIIVYKHMFGTSAREYFFKSAVYLSVALATGALASLIFTPLLQSGSWVAFFGVAILCAVFINVVFFVAFFKTPEFVGVKKRILSMIKK